MSMQLRRLNEKGVDRFRSYVTQLRDNPALPPPVDLLDDPDLTVIVPEVGAIDRRGFETKRQAAEYLRSALKPLLGQDIFRDVGLWCWLTLFYFDDVCPAKSGKRKALKTPHYVLERDVWTRRYRHLLASALFVLVHMPTHNRMLLESALPVFGDVAEQLLSRFFVIRVPGVAEALDKLYFDRVLNRPKSGIVSQKRSAKAGDLRNRFPVRISQLSKTYDIRVLTGDQLISLLGKEFEGWLAA